MTKPVIVRIEVIEADQVILADAYYFLDTSKAKAAYVELHTNLRELVLKWNRYNP